MMDAGRPGVGPRPVRHEPALGRGEGYAMRGIVRMGFVERAAAWAAVAALCIAACARGETAEGIAYREGDGAIAERCVVDVYRPDGTPDDAGLPVLVWFHAGGLTGGGRWVPEGFKDKGFVVIAEGYRLSPTVEARVCIEDAAAAVAWAIDHAAEHGGDPSRIVVTGHSAGGYLASMVGLDRRWLAAHGKDPDDLAGLAPISGHAVTHFTVRAERGIPGERVVVDDLAPIHHVRADAPPVLMISGDREKEMLGRYEESAFFWRMMRVAGHRDTELLELDGYDHGGVVRPAQELVVSFARRVTG